MTATGPVPAPHEASDPERARASKAKIRDCVSDVRRHLLALRTVMAEFGEDFELDAFHAAHSRAGARVGAARDQQLPGFYDAYRAWIKRGFLSKSSDALARARGRT